MSETTFVEWNRLVAWVVLLGLSVVNLMMPYRDWRVYRHPEMWVNTRNAMLRIAIAMFYGVPVIMSMYFGARFSEAATDAAQIAGTAMLYSWLALQISIHRAFKRDRERVREDRT